MSGQNRATPRSGFVQPFIPADRLRRRADFYVSDPTGCAGLRAEETGVHDVTQCVRNWSIVAVYATHEFEVQQRLRMVHNLTRASP